MALALIDLRTIRTFQNFRPLVIRIDDLGRAEAINYHNLEYKPQDAEAKYFLSQFCALYYRRNRYTIQDDFSKSLYFLDGKLADGILDAYRKDDIIKKFITNTAAPEIDVDVKKVALEEMQTPPFRARVDFYMVYYSPADHSELKRDLYTANFVFVFKSQVPNELIPINPLGHDHHLLPRRPGIQMRIPVHTQTEEVAGGRRATSAQPRAPAPLCCIGFPPHRRHIPTHGFSPLELTGAPLEGLLFAPLSARSQKRKALSGNLHRTCGIHDDRQRTARHHRHPVGYGFWLLDQLKFMARLQSGPVPRLRNYDSDFSRGSFSESLWRRTHLRPPLLPQEYWAQTLAPRQAIQRQPRGHARSRERGGFQLVSRDVISHDPQDPGDVRETSSRPSVRSPRSTTPDARKSRNPESQDTGSWRWLPGSGPGSHPRRTR